MSKIKVLFWDFDGTISDLSAMQYYLFNQTKKDLNIDIDDDKFYEDFEKINLHCWEKYERGEYTTKDVYFNRFDKLFKQYNIDRDPYEASMIFEKHVADKPFIHDNADEIIKSLMGKYKQYATTNGASEIQKAKLKVNGIINYFDAIFVSGDIGFNKPQKEYFDKVISFIGDYKRDEIMIIGDSQTSDMLGANNAGIVSCYYNPQKKDIDKNLHIDYQISSLNEIYKILEN